MRCLRNNWPCLLVFNLVFYRMLPRSLFQYTFTTTPLLRYCTCLQQVHHHEGENGLFRCRFHLCRPEADPQGFCRRACWRAITALLLLSFFFSLFLFFFSLLSSCSSRLAIPIPHPPPPSLLSVALLTRPTWRKTSIRLACPSLSSSKQTASSADCFLYILIAQNSALYGYLSAAETISGLFISYHLHLPVQTIYAQFPFWIPDPSQTHPESNTRTSSSPLPNAMKKEVHTIHYIDHGLRKA